MPNHHTTLAVGVARPEDFDVVKFNSMPTDWNFCEQVRPMPTGEGRDWAEKNWGTARGTYQERAFDIGGDGTFVVIKFQTAWGPPNASCLRDIAEWMDRELGVESVKFIGCDPFDDSIHLLEEAVV